MGKQGLFRRLGEHLLAGFGVLTDFRRTMRQGDLEHLLDAGDVVDGDALHLFRQDVLFHILLVFRREDDVGDSGALGGQELLLHPADGKHVSAEGDLTGHRHLRPHLLIGEQGDQRGDDGDTGRGTILGNGSGGHVDMQDRTW